MLAEVAAVLAVAAPVVDCSRQVVGPVPPGGAVHAGAVAFYGLRDARSRRFGRGVVVRFRSQLGARARVTVSIARRDRAWLALEYGGTRSDGSQLTLADGRPTFRFRPCAGARETRWAGGFLVARPGCATLRIRREGTRRWRTRRAGFGRRCP
jgi:hypothetical protein